MTQELTAAVDVQDVWFSFGRRAVLRGISLQITPGQSFGLLGPNGAGKTTLIRLLVGLLRPRTGRIAVLGEQPSSRVSARLGYMPQLPALYAELTVLGNIDFFARIYGLDDSGERRARVEETVRLVGLWSRRQDQVLHLSGGMRQRVSLACAMVHQPPLLFLDEPTVGLDPELRASFWEHFHGLTAEGATLVISSHTMDDAARCDRLAFLRDGQVIAQGTPAELRRAAGAPDCTLEDAFLHFARKESQVVP